MITILGQCLDMIVKEKDYNGAWLLAKTDPTMNADVDKNQWMNFARNAIIRRMDLDIPMGSVTTTAEDVVLSHIRKDENYSSIYLDAVRIAHDIYSDEIIRMSWLQFMDGSIAMFDHNNHGIYIVDKMMCKETMGGENDKPITSV